MSVKAERRPAAGGRNAVRQRGCGSRGRLGRRESKRARANAPSDGRRQRRARGEGQRRAGPRRGRARQPEQPSEVRERAKFELRKLRSRPTAVRIAAAAQAGATLLSQANMQIFGTRRRWTRMSEQFMRAASLGHRRRRVDAFAPPDAQHMLERVASSVAMACGPPTCPLPDGNGANGHGAPPPRPRRGRGADRLAAGSEGRNAITVADRNSPARARAAQTPAAQSVSGGPRGWDERRGPGADARPPGGTAAGVKVSIRDDINYGIAAFGTDPRAAGPRAKAARSLGTVPEPARPVTGAAVFSRAEAT